MYEDCGYTYLVPDNELEETLCKIVDNVAVEINDRNIESCHCVGSHSCMIVKFSHRKDCQQLMNVKKQTAACNEADSQLLRFKWYGKGKILGK